MEEELRRNLRKVNMWCLAKSSDNSGGRPWQECPGCCQYCSKENCPLRICQARDERNCSQRCSPSEWMLAKIDERAERLIYKTRRYTLYLKKGFRPADGTWEGTKLAIFWKKYPKIYQEIFEKAEC